MALYVGNEFHTLINDDKLRLYITCLVFQILIAAGSFSLTLIESPGEHHVI